MTTRQVAELYARAGKQAPAGIAAPDASKYNSRKKELDGHTFDSAGEAEAYRYLKRDESCGVISNLELQPRFRLQEAFRDEQGKHHRAIEYVADFGFLDINGEYSVIDFKGVRTPIYRMKLKMFKATFPDIKFNEWDRSTLREMQGK